MSETDDTQVGQLKDLSKQLSFNLAEVAVGARKVVKTSSSGILSGFPFNLHPGYLQLASFSINWELFIEQRSNKSFFGFRRKNQFDNSLRTKISFKLTPVEQLPQGASKQKLAYQWSPPAFIELNPPDNFVQHVFKDGKNNHGNVLWIKDPSQPGSLMAFCFNKPKRLPLTDIYWFSPKNSTAPRAIIAKKAPFDWFEVILTAVIPWINGEFSPPVSIALDNTSSQIRNILKALSENYIICQRNLVKQQKQAGNGKDSLANYLDTAYLVSDYDASITLRLDKEENLNTEESMVPKSIDLEEDDEGLFDEEDPEMVAKGLFDDQELFQIGVNMKGFREDNRPLIRFGIYPPDFVTEGPVFESFLDCFLKEVRKTEKIAKHLNVTQDILEKALTTPDPGSFIFRIGKKGLRDLEVFVLRVENEGTNHLIMFRANFIFDPNTNRVIFKKKIKNLISTNSDGSHKLEFKGVEYLIRLLWQLNQWKNNIL
ncbi:MAG: hypothetical protein AAF502_11190 [Bacteroidota bacterium]